MKINCIIILARIIETDHDIYDGDYEDQEVELVPMRIEVKQTQTK